MFRYMTKTEALTSDFVYSLNPVRNGRVDFWGQRLALNAAVTADMVTTPVPALLQERCVTKDFREALLPYPGIRSHSERQA